MTNIKATKRALGSSVLALFLCFAMLLGSTYAWFTDSVTSANNIITAGNLDVELYWSTNATDWKEVSDGTNVFEDVDYWEPGKTQVVYLKVVNAGTLALKYKLGINIASETISTNINNEKLQLSEHIMYGITPCTAAYANSAAAIAAVNTDEIQAKNLTHVYAGEFADLYPKANTESKASEQMLAMVVYMPETVGNEANHMQGAPVPEIKLGINLFATQTTVESDSFDDKYDADADKMYTVNGVKYDSAEEALTAAGDGDKVFLSSVTEPIKIEKNIELTLENTYIVAGEGVDAITVNAASATIIFKGYNMVVGGLGANGIYVGAPSVPGTPIDTVDAETYGVILSGDGTLIAKGNKGIDGNKDEKGGSGIYGDANSTLVIKDLKTVIAEGYGKAGFGIGGATKSITIENSNIDYAKGGIVNSKIGTNYGKQDPEGGAAIGSMSDGAVINIIGSTIKRADGGSKAAGIGARFWTGVTVNITNSEVTAFGGSSSAGIGGSRITKHKSAMSQAINVTITNSTVNATGGDFAAGIGSGYNTYCAAARPMITVTIDAESNITAQGGWLGAGVGTGHNVIDFTGNIACDTTNIKAGSSEDPSWCCWGNPCTLAKDIGLGVYSINNFIKEVSNQNELAEALSSGKNVVLNEDVSITDEIVITGKTNIDLNEKELTVSRIEAVDGGELTISGGTLVSAESDYPAISVKDGGKLILEDVKVVSENYCNLMTSNGKQAAEFVGVQVFGGTCVLDNVDIVVNIEEKRFANSAIGVGIHGGELIMNGGSITVTSVGSTNEKYDSQSAIFAGSETDKKVTLNNVDVTAKEFLCTSRGKITVNTTDAEGAWNGKCSATNGGTYTINYNYAG